MTDLFTTLPDFSAKQHAHLIPSLEKNGITTTDLLTVDAAELAKRALVPPAAVRQLADDVLTALQAQLGLGQEHRIPKQREHTAVEDTKSLYTNGEQLVQQWRTISTLDTVLDEALGGGIPTGQVTEITGESGAGKTQLLLTLLLSAQLLPHHRSPPTTTPTTPYTTIYISTEASLSTPRLTQLLSAHPSLQATPASLSNILSIQTQDLETQEHILRYQLPVALSKHAVSLVVVDSIAANFRAEFDNGPGGRRGRAGGGGMGTGGGGGGVEGRERGQVEAMARRTVMLTQLGALLREIARRWDVAVVVANQVADRFERIAAAAAAATTMPQGSMGGTRDNELGGTLGRVEDPLTLDHQQRWFTGWGDDPKGSEPNQKTPSLGLVWTNQIAARIALIKEPVVDDAPISSNIASGTPSSSALDEPVGRDVKWRRKMRVVFAPWAKPSRPGQGVEFVITKEGLKAGAREQ